MKLNKKLNNGLAMGSIAMPILHCNAYSYTFQDRMAFCDVYLLHAAKGPFFRLMFLRLEALLPIAPYRRLGRSALPRDAASALPTPR